MLFFGLVFSVGLSLENFLLMPLITGSLHSALSLRSLIKR